MFAPICLVKAARWGKKKKKKKEGVTGQACLKTGQVCLK